MKAFDELYNEYYTRVYNLAVHLLRDHENASDISQDVFIELYGSLMRKKEIKNERAWLYKVTSNLCFSHLKKKRRINGLELEKRCVKNDENLKSSIVLKALKKLSEKDQMLLTLYNDGLTYKELSEITGIKYVSVGKTLSRALKRLKNEVEKERRLSDR